MLTGMLAVVLKWLAQALVVIVGVWGLFTEPFRVDPETGRKSLGGVGWLKIVLLAVGFGVFVVSDWNESKRAEVESARQEQQIESQARNLDYLRRLLLLQYRLSNLELTLEFPRPVLERFRGRIEGFRGEGVDATQLAYLGSALLAGQTSIRYRNRHEGDLDYWLNRPQGVISTSVDGSSDPWRAFVSALSELFGGLFQIRSGSGRVLVDLLSPAYPIELGFRDGALVVSIPEPGIRLDELSGEVFFVCGQFEHLYTDSPYEVDGEDYEEPEDDERTRRRVARKIGPDRVRLASGDPRVQLDQEFDVNWTPHVVREQADWERDETYGSGQWHSRPYALSPDLSQLGIDE